MNDNLMGQLTYKQFFKAVLLMFPAVGMYAFTMITGKMDKNNLILSLFLMLLYALIYVIALYIVFTKYDFEWTEKLDNSGERVKKTILYSIYEVRIAIRLAILMFAFTNACKTMMVNRHNDLMIVVPLIIVMLYLGGKGLKGYVCFIEAIFWSVSIVGIFVAIFCFKNINLTQMLEFVKFHLSGSVTGTVRSVLIRGYVLLIVFSMMEFIMLLYIRIKNRKRGMLLSSVGIALIISIIASVFVISVLGWHAISSGTKSILNIVGAFEFPGGSMARLGILACFLLMTYGIVAMQIHFVVSLDVINGFVKDRKKSFIWKCVWALGLICIYFLAKRILSGENMYELVLKYMAVVDIPLSVILPALMGKHRFDVKKTVAVISAVLFLFCMTGCSYQSIEDVDYATVIILEQNSDDETDVYDYTFVIDTLNTESSDSVTEQMIWNIKGDSFENMCDAYDKTHNKTLDLSHVEYIVAKSEDELREIYPELLDEFTTKYVNVVYEENIIEKAMGEDIKGYLDAHYRGKCLASIDIYE